MLTIWVTIIQFLIHSSIPQRKIKRKQNMVQKSEFTIKRSLKVIRKWWVRGRLSKNLYGSSIRISHICNIWLSMNNYSMPLYFKERALRSTSSCQNQSKVVLLINVAVTIKKWWNITRTSQISSLIFVPLRMASSRKR